MVLNKQADNMARFFLKFPKIAAVLVARHLSHLERALSEEQVPLQDIAMWCAVPDQQQRISRLPDPLYEALH